MDRGDREDRGDAVGREDRVGRAGVIVFPLPMLTLPVAMIRPSRYVIPSLHSNDEDN